MSPMLPNPYFRPAPRKAALAGICVLLVALVMMVPIGAYGKNHAPTWMFLGIPLAAVGFALMIPRGRIIATIGGGFVGGICCSLLAVTIGGLWSGKPTPPLAVALLPIYAAYRFTKLSYSGGFARTPPAAQDGTRH